MSDSLADKEGNVVPASHYGMSSDFPLEMMITVVIEEQEGKTKLTLTHVGIPPGEDRAAQAGWNGRFRRALTTPYLTFGSSESVLRSRILDSFPTEVSARRNVTGRTI